MVTDNGPQFVAEDSRSLSDENGIQHIRVAPYHPRSNGMAERFVQTFKASIKKMANEEGDNSKKTSQLPAGVQENPSIHYHGSSSYD